MNDQASSTDGRMTKGHDRPTGKSRTMYGVVIFLIAAVIGSVGIGSSFLIGRASVGTEHIKPDLAAKSFDRHELAIGTEDAKYIITVTDGGLAKGVTIVPKSDDVAKRGSDLSVNFVGLAASGPMFESHLACKLAQSPCVFDRPIAWSTLYVAEALDGAKAIAVHNPYLSQATNSLRCTSAKVSCKDGYLATVESDSFTSHFLVDKEGALLGVHLLLTEKNFHLNIKLADGRNLDCSTIDCRIWQNGGSSIKIATVTKDGWINFRDHPLLWTQAQASSAGGMDRVAVRRPELKVSQ